MYLYEKRGFYQVEMEKEGILSLHLYIQTHTNTLMSFHTSNTNDYSNSNSMPYNQREL